MSSIDVITLEDSAECAAKLLEAARTLGFVYITLKGTDITPAKVDDMFKIVRSLSLATVGAALNRTVESFL